MRGRHRPFTHNAVFHAIVTAPHRAPPAPHTPTGHSNLIRLIPMIGSGRHRDWEEYLSPVPLASKAARPLECFW